MTPTFSQLGERLHNRRFAVTNNTHGLSGAGTVFHYLVRVTLFPAPTKAVEFA